MKKSENVSSCDWQAKPFKKVKKSSDESVIYRYRGDYKWGGTKTDVYKQVKGDWNRIVRRVLIGDNLKTKSHVRYFEIARGGRSSFEKHHHEHIVIGIRGKGKVLLDKKLHRIGFLDVVYISPTTPHQLLNPFNEPFGFLCIVPAKRDRPRLMS